MEHMAALRRLVGDGDGNGDGDGDGRGAASQCEAVTCPSTY
jgi:hypothetical protein